MVAVRGISNATGNCSCLRGLPVETSQAPALEARRALPGLMPRDVSRRCQARVVRYFHATGEDVV